MKKFRSFLAEMAADVQNRGTCQICGRVQAVRDKGNITHHGYTIEYGWFQGTCPGQRHKPLEHDKSETEKQIGLIEKEIPEIEKRIKKLKAGKIHPLKISNGSTGFGRNRQNNWIDWADAPSRMQEEAVRSAIYDEERRIKDGHATIKFLKELIDKVHGKDLVKIDKTPKAGIEVGSKIKVWGDVQTVTKIKDAVARGVGPFMNGHTVPHVFWTDAKGHEHSTPKRLVRLVKE